MKQLKKFALGLLLFPVTIFAQEIDYSKPIPFDSTVKTGKLKNGLTYYIKKNAKPENKVDLRLVVNAGSILENDDQQGLAHFMEHMNFNGTKRFPKNKLVDYLQSIGVKFGQHLNAYTSFEETVYFLPIPSDSPEKLENGFNIIEDWAFNANLTPEEIEKERGVVLEEYRLGLGAQKRMLGRYLPKMMYKSHYADRLPIGKKEILEKFQYDKIISFYKDWYRPDLMSVIVVGDIDVAQMEKKVIAHFSNYQNPENEKPRKTYEVPNHKETFVAIESDKEESSAQVQLLYKDYGLPKPVVTIKDFKNSLVEGLFTTMLNARLDELTNCATPPFTYGYSYYGQTWARNKKAYQSFAMSQEDKQLSALKVLVTENERARKFGFTQGELDRSKADFLASIEKRFNDRNKTNSENFVSEYQGNFLEKEPSPGIEWTFNMMKKILPGIKLNDVNGFIKEYIKDDNRVVILTGPEKGGLKKPSEQDVLNALKVNADQIKPYEDIAVAKGLLRNQFAAGTIVKRESNDKMGTKTLFLSNGAKVTYKNTDYKNDEVLFEAVSLGGSSLYSNEEMRKVQFANGALAEAGFSGLKLNDINKFMTGKIASVAPYISTSTEGLRGNATPKDLEYLFQMTHAYFTDLNLDVTAFEGYKQKQSAFFKNLASQPGFYFQQEFYTYLNKENPRFNGLIPTEKTWGETDYTMAYKKYKERFANAGDFEFYFVGNVDDQTMESYASKYIASLPASDKKEKAADTGYRFLKGDLKKVVNKGADPKSSVTIMYYGDAVYSPKEAAALEALGEVLTIKLIEELRENESGVYGISARGSMNKVPYQAFNFNIGFPCGPENAEKLTASALKELQKIIDNGPEAKDIAKFKEAELLDYKKNIKENKYWLSNFTKSFINGTNPAEILQTEEKISEITAKDIQDVAKKYLTKDKVIGMLMPEKS
ncbi:pitrilysin family protein [Flavobacterium sp. GT3R68]|uniref:M16 family metallopeptidase n=1 Tax=Flavobacterium sp. GT3R68 TaxID=2594437 RepID=UPI000F86106E|nr:insulinase family protein [Flavobacterium sp. GT3R68]RTY87528.1 insulinase family protein [Flavobacterium sp. GSN2]TRW90439.1 insulinase family protein [Flavobacterium sp. GT3R68]